MRILQFIRHEFDSRTRHKGEHLVQTDKVTRYEGNAWDAEADFADGHTSVLGRERQSQAVVIDCNCEDFEDGSRCQHVWATLLMAEEAGHLVAKGRPPSWVSTEATTRRIAAPPPADWRKLIREAATQPYRTVNPQPAVWPPDREVFLVLGGHDVAKGAALSGSIMHRDRKRDGEWGKVKMSRFERAEAALIPDVQFRELLLEITRSYNRGESVESVFELRGMLIAPRLRAMCESGRCFVAPRGTAVVEDTGPESWIQLRWDDGDPWRFRCVMSREGAGWVLEGAFERNEERVTITGLRFVHHDGILCAEDFIARADFGGSHLWYDMLAKRSGRILVPEGEAAEFAAELAGSGNPPPVRWPEELAYQEVSAPPSVHFRIEVYRNSGAERLGGTIRYIYGDRSVTGSDAARVIADLPNKRLYRRDLAVEGAAVEVANRAGLKFSYFDYSKPPAWEVSKSKLAKVIRELTEAGWRVEVDGKAFRQASSVTASLDTGIDWFDLKTAIDYDGMVVLLPALLKAIRAGDSMVPLPDGSLGLIPPDFMEKYGLLIELGNARGDVVRFGRGQAGLLDVLLAERPEVKADEKFQEARSALHGFNGLQPAAQPEGFAGQLRDYQREGLAWFEFLNQFGFGGCLADDMGVGKTPQVLALLEERRAAGAGPSLVVIPRSLVFNWKQEAAKFTPELRLLDNTVAGRQTGGEAFAGYNVVLSTYGTLRRDAPELRNFEFDYAILDEAQAIKNPASESAKAARLINARRRIVMSGTPVENHLGELWSLFEFLNPGMLGAAKIFQGAGALRAPNPETRGLLARALRPFILRRTKEQVASELPAKIEQTLYCELDTAQRKLYDELRDYYRQSLLGIVEQEGLAKAKIHVLEALLRLRQAACHPALVNKKYSKDPSAKLDVLLERLEEVVAEGHKALVFSQFTNMLAIVKWKLDSQGIQYEYLDGKTRDRQERVERFQGADGPPVFLISLKAGGVGLNLTAADYVFLLDPWWNPAVEAQAVDRTHRIGQDKRVFAYRLIARDTVEEKVLQLQAKKRELAEAIIGEDNSLIRDLGREDIEMLLS